MWIGSAVATQTALDREDIDHGKRQPRQSDVFGDRAGRHRARSRHRRLFHVRPQRRDQCQGREAGYRAVRTCRAPGSRDAGYAASRVADGSVGTSGRRGASDPARKSCPFDKSVMAGERAASREPPFPTWMSASGPRLSKSLIEPAVRLRKPSNASPCRRN